LLVAPLPQSQQPRSLPPFWTPCQKRAASILFKL